MGVTALRFSNSGDVRTQHGDNDGGGASPANEVARGGVREVHEAEGYTAVPKWHRIVLGLGGYPCSKSTVPEIALLRRARREHVG